MYDQLIEAMEKAIQEVKEWPEKAVQVYHHNDADGLSSGAILTRSFERQGIEVRRFCMEKPYPAVLKKVYEGEGSILIFADFAGRIAPMISELNGGRNLTENHKILIDMELSHEKLIYLCNLALEKGALGAKLTGGGMGGYMVALTPGKDLQESVASAMEKEGYKVIRATIGGN